MFENKKDSVQGIHYSRFIASFAKAGGNVLNRDEFGDWLDHLGFLNEDEVLDILDIATCGKIELELDANIFLKQRKSNSKD